MLALTTGSPTMVDGTTSRGWRPRSGLAEVVVFNWPKLALGVAVSLAGGLVVALGLAPPRLALIVASGTAVSSYLVVASLAVSWWVYDRSDLSDWSWLRPLLATGPEAPSWALVHAGFDEAGPDLPAAVGAPVVAIDIGRALRSVSPSLRRARRRCPARATLTADGARLPLADASLDAVALIFTAHEVRSAVERRRHFAELRRVVAPGGRVVVVEHARDLANIVVFGPGAWHFQPDREWQAVAGSSGLTVVAKVRQSEFVTAYVLAAKEEAAC